MYIYDGSIAVYITHIKSESLFRLVVFQISSSYCELQIILNWVNFFIRFSRNDSSSNELHSELLIVQCIRLILFILSVQLTLFRVSKESYKNAYSVCILLFSRSQINNSQKQNHFQFVILNLEKPYRF